MLLKRINILECQERVAVGIGIRVSRKPPGCPRIIVCGGIPCRIGRAAHSMPMTGRTFLMGNILGAVEKRAISTLDSDLSVVLRHATGAEGADYEGYPDQDEVICEDYVEETRHSPASEVCLGGCEQDHDAKWARVRRGNRSGFRNYGQS